MSKEFPIKQSKEVKTKTIKSEKKDVILNKPENKVKTIIGYPPKLRDIPMYDPQTGEPNPHYEKLTGKKNPLAQIREIGASNNGMLVPQNFEPKKINRFLVQFPEALGVEPFLVSEIKLPSIARNKTYGSISISRMLGVIDLDISDLEIKMIDDSVKPKIAVMYSWLQDNTKFDMKVQTLDSKNVVIGLMTLKDCYFTRIDFGSLGYSLDSDVYNYSITISPSSIKVD
jgi:hypothetical protein